MNSIAKSITVLEKENLNKSSLYTHLPTMGDDLGKFQDYPRKTVGGVVFTRIYYICISKYLKT